MQFRAFFTSAVISRHGYIPVFGLKKRETAPFVGATKKLFGIFHAD